MSEFAFSSSSAAEIMSGVPRTAQHSRASLFAPPERIPVRAINKPSSTPLRVTSTTRMATPARAAHSINTTTNTTTATTATRTMIQKILPQSTQQTKPQTQLRKADTPRPARVLPSFYMRNNVASSTAIQNHASASDNISEKRQSLFLETKTPSKGILRSAMKMTTPPSRSPLARSARKTSKLLQWSPSTLDGSPLPTLESKKIEKVVSIQPEKENILVEPEKPTTRIVRKIFAKPIKEETTKRIIDEIDEKKTEQTNLKKKVRLTMSLPTEEDDE
eukprot:TRINITY_DN2034_c0_g1_i1.p1 TRINITY_DN2034_c0_g1~~TRINITY_DN2034_c0_g1_i1.p1  ORF type:complete len:276 (+),score=111.46 TRINITY_DN2034_c0_g1_i1:19-846(+)